MFRIASVKKGKEMKAKEGARGGFKACVSCWCIRILRLTSAKNICKRVMSRDRP